MGKRLMSRDAIQFIHNTMLVTAGLLYLLVGVALVDPCSSLTDDYINAKYKVEALMRDVEARDDKAAKLLPQAKLELKQINEDRIRCKVSSLEGK